MYFRCITVVCIVEVMRMPAPTTGGEDFTELAVRRYCVDRMDDGDSYSMMAVIDRRHKIPLRPSGAHQNDQVQRRHQLTYYQYC